MPSQLTSYSTPARAAVAAALAMFAGAALAGPVRSVGTMTFVDANTVVVADWRGDELHALRLPPVAPVADATPFNLKNVSAPIARALHTSAGSLRFKSMAFRPGAELAYVGISVERDGAAPVPALVAVDPAGKVKVVDLSKTPQTSVTVANPPAADKRIWRDIPEASFTVTDMVTHDGKLYVAGLSSASFASTLRVYDFPFTGGASSTTSIEMYHAVHDQVETRAPIRKMAIIDVNGEPTLLAAYTCTPLVTIALKDLKNGAHIVGKTIGEMGWGSNPVGMLTFDAGKGPVVLLANSHKSADLMSVASIAEAAARPGITTPIKVPDAPLEGIQSTYVPISGVAALGAQDAQFIGALRRNVESGEMELVSIRKGALLRLSDFVNEYDFDDYHYRPGDHAIGAHRTLRTDEGYPDLAARAK